MTEEQFKLLFSEKLKSKIKQAGITSRELAKKVDLEEVTISRYCNGTRMPNIYFAYNIANALNTSVSELMDFGMDEFEAAGFDVELCKELRDIRDKYNINPCTLISLINHFDKSRLSKNKEKECL